MEADPSWFGFLMIVHKDADFTKNDIVKFLEEHKIATRMLFAGNITRHPSYKNVNFRVYGNLENTNRIMYDSFWIGVYPGMKEVKLDYVVKIFNRFIEGII